MKNKFNLSSILPFLIIKFETKIGAIVNQDVDFGHTINAFVVNYLFENPELNQTIRILLGDNEKYGMAVRELGYFNFNNNNNHVNYNFRYRKL